MIFTREELFNLIDTYLNEQASNILMVDEELEYENPILNISFIANVGNFESPQEKQVKNYNFNVVYTPTK